MTEAEARERAERHNSRGGSYVARAFKREPLRVLNPDPGTPTIYRNVIIPLYISVDDDFWDVEYERVN